MDPIGGAKILARRFRAGSFGICVNYAQHCSMFEKRVAAIEGDTCSECGQHLMHESGLTWEDARKKEQAEWPHSEQRSPPSG